MRKIPSSMATQHPDMASTFVPVRDEPEEAVNALDEPDKGFGCEEYLIDYMGKLTPYHQIGLVVKALKERTDLVLGEDVFITPRMVSDFYDEPFRQLMTLLAVMEGVYYSASFYQRQGLVEIVQAATGNVNELVKCYHRANRFFPLLEKELNLKTEESELRLIPLFEGLPLLSSIKEIVTEYIKKLGLRDYLRAFIGKSETAISAGHVSSALACKMAISDCASLQEELGVEIHPIFGGGALPFRGFIAPENLQNFTSEYSGAKTYTIQSALRHDRDKGETVSMVRALRDKVRSRPLEYSDDEREKIREMMAIFSKNYLQELYEILDHVMAASRHIPDQRERIRDYEDVAYYRSIRHIETMLGVFRGKKQVAEISQLPLVRFGRLPRAIKLSASLYTLGLPPEFIGTGNSLEEIGKELGQDYVDLLLDKIYPSLEGDIRFSSRYYCPTRIETPRISRGIKALKSMFPFEPPEERHQALSKIASAIVSRSEARAPEILILHVKDDIVSEYLKEPTPTDLSRLILDMGRIRGALG